MKRWIGAAALLLLATAAQAADNAIVLTPGLGVVERSKDVGAGVQSPVAILGDTSGNPLATVPGTGNTLFALPIQGVAGGVALPVSGTFWQATQPVSGTFWQTTQPVSGTFWQATQPVSGTFWQTTQPVSLNATPSLVNGNGIVPTQGGNALSATNGIFSNVLQGNAVLSATNGLFANLLQGNAVLSSGNPLFVEIVSGSTANQNVNLNQVGGNSVVTGGVNGSQGIGGLAATGGALAGNPVLVGGSDGTDVRNLSTNAAGNLLVGAAQATVSAGNAQSSQTANGNGTAISVAGYGAALIDVNCSVNCSGGTVISFTATDVVGNYVAVGAIPISGQSQAVTSVTNQTGQILYCVPNLGYTTLRTPITSYSAGTISVTITPINANGCPYAQIANASTPGAAASSASSPVTLPALAHTSVTSLGTSLVAKAAAGNLNSFNCTAITGGAAGFCIAYNGTTAPSTGALTGANVLDSCYFDTTARGCSLAHINGSVAFSTGIVILVSSAVTPFTYTTGTDTAFISADTN